MVVCSAFGCKNSGNHLFPKEPELRKQWEAAVKRINFYASNHSRLCSDHFKPEDYLTEGRYSGVKHQKKILKKGAVPSVVSWKKFLEDSAAERRKKQAESRDIRRQMTPQIKSEQDEKCLHKVSHKIEVSVEENKATEEDCAVINLP